MTEPRSSRMERLAERWVELYTTGLAESVVSDRRAELRSDRWEQRRVLSSPRRYALELLGRTLRGIPADVLWRRSQIGRIRTLPIADRPARRRRRGVPVHPWIALRLDPLFDQSNGVGASPDREPVDTRAGLVALLAANLWAAGGRAT